MQALWEALGSLAAIDTARLTDVDVVLRLILQVFLLAGSAFFSMSDTALFSLSRVNLQQLRQRRHPQADTLHALLDHPRQLIISILCGNELINIAASVNLASILLTLYGRPEAAALANILIMFPLLMLCSEVTPKTVAVSNPMRFAADVVARPIAAWVKIVAPLRVVVRAVADRLTSLIVGHERAAKNILRVDEFRTLLDDVAERGEVSAVERTIIDNLLAADDTEIVQIMVPRPRIRYLSDAMSMPEIFEAFRRFEYARVPVYRENRDTVIGILHAEDVLQAVLSGREPRDISLDELLRPALFVPPTKRIVELFALLSAEETNCALVLNEFGGIDGFVTLNDVIGFIFGDLVASDSHRPTYVEESAQSFLVSASMRLEAFDRLTNLGLTDSRMATIGGVVYRVLDRVPAAGDAVDLPGCRAIVVEMDGKRISKLRITKAGATSGDAAPEATAEDSRGPSGPNLPAPRRQPEQPEA